MSTSANKKPASLPHSPLLTFSENNNMSTFTRLLSDLVVSHLTLAQTWAQLQIARGAHLLLTGRLPGARG